MNMCEFPGKLVERSLLFTAVLHKNLGGASSGSRDPGVFYIQSLKVGDWVLSPSVTTQQCKVTSPLPC